MAPRRTVSSPQDVDISASLATRFDAARLIVPADDGTIWIWLGARSRQDPDRLADHLSTVLPGDSRAGVGEVAYGARGWRLTHQQARSARTVAVRRSDVAVRYADVAVLASALGDDLLIASLHALYLDPLEGGGADGEVLRATIRAYLQAERNVTSAAAALGVSRNTVTNRLRTIESRLGPLRPSRFGALALAFSLSDLEMPERSKFGPSD